MPETNDIAFLRRILASSTKFNHTVLDAFLKLREGILLDQSPRNSINSDLVVKLYQGIEGIKGRVDTTNNRTIRMLICVK